MILEHGNRRKYKINEVVNDDRFSCTCRVIKLARP